MIVSRPAGPQLSHDDMQVRTPDLTAAPPDPHLRHYLLVHHACQDTDNTQSTPEVCVL